MSEFSVVFLGSGPVAAESLHLLNKHTTIEAVITKSSTETMLRNAAPSGVPVYTANNRRELDALIVEKQFSSPVGIVIDYGVIISGDTINHFPLGILNSHFSLLPEWRGADPITFSILSGQTETGVSLMRIDEGLDTGDLLAQAPYKLTDGINSIELTHDLIEVSDGVIRSVLPDYIAGTIQPADQISASIAPIKVPTHSRKLTKLDGILDPNKPARELDREVRAFIEWPKTRAIIAEKDVVLTSTDVIDLQFGEPGDVAQRDKHLFLQTADGSLDVLTLKPAGKNEMTAAAFLAGYGQNIPKL